MKKLNIEIKNTKITFLLFMTVFFAFGLLFFIAPPILSNKYSKTDYVILEGTFEYSAYNSEGHYRDVYKVNVGNEEKLVNVQSDGEKKDATYTMKFKYKPEEEKFYLYDPNEKEGKDTSGIQFSAFGAMFLLIGIVMILGFTGGINEQLFFGLMFIIFGGTGAIVLMIQKDYSTLPLMLFWIVLGLIVALVPSIARDKKKEVVNNE